MTTNKREGFEYSKRGQDRLSLKHSFANRLIYSLGKDPITATHRDWFDTTAYAALLTTAILSIAVALFQKREVG